MKPLVETSMTTIETMLHWMTKHGYSSKNLILAEIEAEMWNDKQCANFILSVLVGVPMPTMTFDVRNRTFKIIDGRKRLYALMRFVEGDLKLRTHFLTNKEVGKHYQTLSPDSLFDFESAVIPVHKIREATEQFVEAISHKLLIQ